MTRLSFHKYHGAGNDFIIVDERQQQFLSRHEDAPAMIARLCHRNFGIGADGLMILQNDPESDFKMFYYNSDGYEGSMCGNGGRCLVSYAWHQKIIPQESVFRATDGLHRAKVISGSSYHAQVALGMNDVKDIIPAGTNLFMDTGSPHLVIFTDSIRDLDVYEQGKALRYSPEFSPGGTNVNFAQMDGDHIHVRTYERGVENETLACGTGITAVAIAAYHKELVQSSPVKIKATGGELSVDFDFENNTYQNIILQGPAEFVFRGEIDM